MERPRGPPDLMKMITMTAMASMTLTACISDDNDDDDDDDEDGDEVLVHTMLTTKMMLTTIMLRTTTMMLTTTTMSMMMMRTFMNTRTRVAFMTDDDRLEPLGLIMHV